LSEVLRGAVVGGSTLVAPAPVWDEVTARVIADERAAAEVTGHARGVREGRAEAAAELAHVREVVSTAVAALHAEVRAQREVAVATDLDLVLAVVDAVLGQAPPASAVVLLERIGEVAALLDDPALEVRCNPGDLDVLGGASLDPRLTLVADGSVPPGEASVAGTWGRADLRRAALRDAALALLTAGSTGVPS
jgi:flagellar assembly protein FliH